MTPSDIVDYRTLSLKTKAWRHVVLCDRALGEPASIVALQHIAPGDRKALEHLPPDDAKRALEPLIGGDPWSRIA